MKTFLKTHTVLAVALAGVSATSLSAGSLADPVVQTTPVPIQVQPAPVPRGADWSGFYAGAQVGYGRVDTPVFDEQGEDLLYGIHAGYNYDLGNFVVGGELDWDQTQISDAGSGIDLDSVARLKLRAGYDAGQYLPYITLGAAQAYTGGALAADDTGAFAGAGVDYQLNNNFRVGGEVLRHQFEDFNGSGSDIDATTIAARVSYNF